MEQNWKARFRLGYILMSMATVFFLSRIENPFTQSSMSRHNIGAACASIACLVLGLIMRDIYHQNPADSHSLKSLLLQYLLYKVVLRRAKRALKVLQTAGKDVASAQHNTLMGILQKASETEYGRRYGFKEIKTRTEFVSKVPLSTYDNYEPYVERLIADRTEVDGKLLTRESVVYIAVTSGTTGKSKRIPITKVTKEIVTKVSGPLVIYNALMRTGVTLSPLLYISYASDLQYTVSGIPTGLISSSFRQVYPHVVAPSAVYQITDELIAVHLHAVFGLLNPHVENIESLFSYLMYTFWKHVEYRWREICDEIESGTLNLTFQNRSLADFVGKDSAEAIEYELKKRSNPRRASELRLEFSRGFTQIAKRVWPQLKSAKIINTGSAAHYGKALQESYLRDLTQICGGHGASEGMFGVNQPFLGEGEFMLLIQISFFEFIPEENITNENPRTLFANELEAGGVYEIVYTSPAGLYRYRLGDVIRVVSKMGECPVYKFEYRTGQILNLGFEKLSESILYKSVQDAINELTGVQLVDYSTTESLFVPQVTCSGTSAKHYVFFLELSREGEDVLLKEEEKCLFDEVLRRNHELYDATRARNSIGPVYIFQVKCGTFSELRRLTSRSVQYKVPRVTRKQVDIDILISNRLPSDL